MFDPVTIIGVASSAFSGLKAAVAAGKELESCLSQITTWAGALSDLDKAAQSHKKKESSLFKSLLPSNGKSIQAQGMEIYAARVTARKQREELRQLIQATQGMNGWHEFLRVEAQIKKERQQAVYAEMERIEKLKEYSIAAAVAVLAITVVAGMILLAVAIKG